MNKARIEYHPLCLMIPSMSAEEYVDLRNHIAGSGLLEPIVIFDGMILDGRHRYQACLDLEIEPTFVQYEHPDSPVDFVIGKNLDRRNLSTSQRAMTFANLCSWRSGENKNPAITVDQENTEIRTNTGVSEAPHGALTIFNAAQKAQVSERTMDRAIAVNKKGDSSLQQLVMSGEVGLTDAEIVVNILPNKTDQKRAVKAAKKNNTKVVEEAKKVQEVPKEQSAYATLDQWAKMSESERDSFSSTRSKTVTFNQQKNDSIEWADWSWNPVTGCKHDCPYCLSGDTPILMANGRVVELSALRVGDQIIGTRQENGYRKLVTTEVKAHWKTRKQAYEITLGDGRTIISSGDHRFLTERGWKFVTEGEITRDANGRLIGQRPFLTTNNHLLGYGKSITALPETDLYRRGYLSGVIRGDGHLKQHKDHRRENSVMSQFRLAMIDGDAIDRADRYLTYFGVDTQRFEYQMNGTSRSPAIRTSSLPSFETIQSLIEYSDEDEYLRGFMAGIFDAEGTGNGATLRIFNSDKQILKTTEAALSVCGFNFIYDTDKRAANKVVRTIRITGGLSEHIKFFQWCDPAIRRKLKLESSAIKNTQDTRIISVRDLGVLIDMYDITTGTEDFIANGVVAHNCYARDIAEELYKQKFEPSFWPSRLSAPMNTKPRPGPSGKNVFSNSMSDLYGRWVPKQWIDLVLQTMRENDQWNFLMLTKFPKRAAEFAYSPNCWIGTSVDLQVRVKAAEDAFEKIDCGVKWLSIEPMIEPIKFSRPELFNWVVIGGASKSTQTPEWIPPFEWIVRVASQFLDHGAKIYLKENGRPKEFPGVITPQNAGDVFHYLKQEKVA